MGDIFVIQDAETLLYSQYHRPVNYLQWQLVNITFSGISGSSEVQLNVSVDNAFTPSYLALDNVTIEYGECGETG